MYDEVLKQGLKIVDGLSSCTQPVYVYMMPNGELARIIISFVVETDINVFFSSVVVLGSYSIPRLTQSKWRCMLI